MHNAPMLLNITYFYYFSWLYQAKEILDHSFPAKIADSFDRDVIIRIASYCNLCLALGDNLLPVKLITIRANS